MYLFIEGKAIVLHVASEKVKNSEAITGLIKRKIEIKCAV